MKLVTITNAYEGIRSDGRWEDVTMAMIMPMMTEELLLGRAGTSTNDWESQSDREEVQLIEATDNKMGVCGRNAMIM